MSAQAKLFSSKTLSLPELAEQIEKKAHAKCEKYQISFGIFKSPGGHRNQNAMVVLTTDDGVNHNVSMRAESIRDMFEQVNEFLDTI